MQCLLIATWASVVQSAAVGRPFIGPMKVGCEKFVLVEREKSCQDHDQLALRISTFS